MILLKLLSSKKISNWKSSIRVLIFLTSFGPSERSNNPVDLAQKIKNEVLSEHFWAVE